MSSRRAGQWVDSHIDGQYPSDPAPWGAGPLPGNPWDGLDLALHGHVADRLHRALVAPVRHLIDHGGRRWRPALVAHTIELLGGAPERFGPLVAALELAHTGSLVVDDVEDGSAVRRGRPTAHAAFGTAVALNAGTAAYFAFDRAIDLTLPDDSDLAGELRALFLAALRAAHMGQALDLQGHHPELEHALTSGESAPVLHSVRLTHRLKSGTLVAAGFTMAALVTCAPPALVGALTDFGMALGTAYQITDDTADLEGVTHDGRPTKTVAEDLRGAKVTLPLAHATARVPADRLMALWGRVRDGARADDGRAAGNGGDGRAATDGRAVEELRRALLSCGAAAVCEEEARLLVDGAWHRLRPLLPHRHPATARLGELARRTVLRSRTA